MTNSHLFRRIAVLPATIIMVVLTAQAAVSAEPEPVTIQLLFTRDESGMISGLE